MATFNRCLAVCIIILATITVVLSSRLYNVRAELRDRADTLASTVNSSRESIKKPTLKLDYLRYHNNSEGFMVDLQEFESDIDKLKQVHDKQIVQIEAALQSGDFTAHRTAFERQRDFLVPAFIVTESRYNRFGVMNDK